MSIFTNIIYSEESVYREMSEFFIVTSDTKKAESIILLTIKQAGVCFFNLEICI